MKPGIYRNFPIDQYYEDPCPAPSLSQSIAKLLIDQSPAHAALEHPRLRPADTETEEKYDKAKAIGSCAHQLLIGRGRDLAIGVFDDWRTKAAREFRDQALAKGKTCILDRHYEEANRIVDAARFQLQALGWADAFRTGSGETCLIWQEGETWFRTLVDWENDHSYDYKTGAVSFAPHNICYKIEADGWHIQAAMHERGWNKLDPEGAGRRKFRFIAQENYPPYALVGVELTEHWLTMGRKALEMAVPIWQRCMATEQWPAYPPQVVRPEFPSFRETRFLQRELEAAGQTILDAG